MTEPGKSREAVLAVDIGGTKTACGAVGRGGEILVRHQVRTPKEGDAEVVFAAVERLVEDVLGEIPDGNRVVACGTGCAGPMKGLDTIVSPLNMPAWKDFPLRRRLEAVSGLPTFVDNDVKALALGEGWAGTARGVANYMSMVVSTGVGGGIVIDGRLLEGASGNAGHVGHVIVDPEGHPCSCGGAGCLEAEASGTAIAAITGRDPREASPEVVARTGRLVGMAVASVVNLLDLELCTVAGSVALGFGDPFFEAANAELRERSRLSFTQGASIVPCAMGATAPLVGAGAVGWSGLGVDVLHDR